MPRGGSPQSASKQRQLYSRIPWADINTTRHRHQRRKERVVYPWSAEYCAIIRGGNSRKSGKKNRRWQTHVDSTIAVLKRIATSTTVLFADFRFLQHNTDLICKSPPHRLALFVINVNYNPPLFFSVSQWLSIICDYIVTHSHSISIYPQVASQRPTSATVPL